jgi:hypothetical protein
VLVRAFALVRGGSEVRQTKPPALPSETGRHGADGKHSSHFSPSPSRDGKKESLLMAS